MLQVTTPATANVTTPATAELPRWRSPLLSYVAGDDTFNGGGDNSCYGEAAAMEKTFTLECCR
ncbi:hypothetical protein EXU57_05360 [Segetibacter sp. 3557_3]|uniref:hypothetical protein n=1 Tax=Segetibacter sp. 3557_3 TaxID=2547429 RepID=UPI0010584786|nr:hypothetical protein [Segetibacter sp. 3557_3]TDH27894.1 hypothetical protein EXU57_05360 [Segetibacter sp. 3557_3]